MLVEAREQTSQIVQVSTHHMRRAFTGNHGEGFFKLQQASCQLRFTIFTDDNRSCSQLLFVNFCFTEHGQYTRVCILHVWRGITLKRQHVVPVEDVVRGAVFGEIRIFHRTNTNCVSQFFQLVGWHIRVLFCHQTTCTLQGFIQQIRQFHCTTRAGFERFAVFAQHHAEHVVFQRYGFRYIACFTDDSPRLHQVLMLTGVDVIQHAIGMQCFITIFRTGDISGGVEIATIFLLNDHAHRFAFLVFELIKEYDGRAFTFYCQTFGFQVRHDTRQHWVVETFTHDVIAGQRHVETIVGDLVLRHGDVDQFAPHLAEIFVTALQFDYVVTCTLGKLFIFVVMLFRIAVETFKVSQLHFTGVFLLLLFQPRNQHTELSTPVADVVRANHFVTEELQSTHCRVTNNGRAQVTDVHLFRHVRSGVVNHNGLFFWRSNTETIGRQRLLNMISQEGWIKKNVDKAWTGDLNFAGDTVKIQMSQHLLC